MNLAAVRHMPLRTAEKRKGMQGRFWQEPLRAPRRMTPPPRQPPGCIDGIAELHGSCCARMVGSGAAFKAKVATELSAFCLQYDPARDSL